MLWAVTCCYERFEISDKEWNGLEAKMSSIERANKSDANVSEFFKDIGIYLAHFCSKCDCRQEDTVITISE